MTEDQLRSAVARIERDVGAIQVAAARLEERLIGRDETNKRIEQVLNGIDRRLDVLERSRGIQGLFDLKDPSNILLWVLAAGWALGATGVANPLAAIFGK